MTSTGESVTADVDLTGRRALVTGASSGLGCETARVLAMLGANVGMVCRNSQRGALAIEDFAKTTGSAAAQCCDVLTCDLESMAAVRSLADALLAAGRPIDLLFLNAGVSGQPFRVTPEGHEATYASNYLGHFLLVHRLATVGALAPHARIVATLSSAVLGNPFAEARLGMVTAPAAHWHHRMSSGPSTKVLLALTGLEFARRAVGTPLSSVTWLGISPGGVRTGNLDQMAPWQRGLVLSLFGGRLRPVEEGVAPLLWAATAEGLAQNSGAVFGRDGVRVQVKPNAADGEASKRLWDLSEERLGLSAWPAR